MATFDPVAATALLVISAACTEYAALRDSRSKKREAELRRAISYLDRHIASLEKLDDDATPSYILEMALIVHRFVTDPDIPDVVRQWIKEDDLDTKIDESHDIAWDQILAAVRKKRPDLAVAFIDCIVSGTLSFVHRWPSCAKAFPMLVADIATHPSQEIEKMDHIRKIKQKNHSELNPPNSSVLAGA